MQRTLTLVLFIVDIFLTVFYTLSTAYSIQNNTGDPSFSAGIAILFAILAAFKYNKLRS